MTAVLSCPAGRGVWESRAGRGRACCAGRGAGCGGQNWGAFVRGGAVSAQGELTLHSPKSKSPESKVDRREAEACFLKAIEIARKQQAKSLELRAATSLARLWQQQGKQKEAHQLLSEIYSWFTEGFDTKDLQEAKALLDSLRSSV